MKNDQFSLLAQGEKNWGVLISGFCCTFFAIFTGLFRWTLFVQAIHLPFRFIDALRIGLMAQFFNLFAFGVLGGDALRAYYVCRIFDRRKSEIIATVVIDRLVGMFTMFGIGTVAFFALDITSLADPDSQLVPLLKTFGWTVSIVTVVGLLFAIVIAIFPEVNQFRILQPLFRLPKVGEGLAKAIGVASVYRNRPTVVIFGLMLSVMTNLFFGLAIFLISSGLSDATPSFLKHLFIEPIVMCSNALPLPGGLGGMELMLNLMYQAFGSPHGVIVAFTFRFSLLILAAIGGCVWMLNRNTTSLRSESMDYRHSTR